MTALRSNRTWIGLLIVFALVGAFIFSGRLTSAQSTTPTTTTFETATVFVGNLETAISANGNLAPSTEASLAFGSSGQVADVLVAAGDTVTEGDVLIRLDTVGIERSVNDAEQTVIIRQAEVDALRTDAIVDAEQRVADAESALEALELDDEVAIDSAEQELENAQADLDTILTDQLARSLQVAEAQLQQAQNALAKAQDQLDSAELTAPFDGIISSVMVQEDDYVSGPVLSLFDPASLAVELEIDEVDLRELDEGVSAELAIDALPSLLLNGTVADIAVAPTPSNSDRVTYAVTVDLDDQDDSLRNGMSTKVWLTTAEREDVLLVPNAAITADNDNGTYFVTLLEDNTQVRVEVTIGVRDRQFTEVTTGLTSGDQVVLRVNQAIQEIEVGPDSPFGND